MGMAGAAVSFSPAARLVRLRDETSWSLVAMLFLLAFVSIAMLFSHGPQKNGELDVPLAWATDLLIGVAAASTMVFCTKSVMERSGARPSLILRLFESQVAVRLGVFSYSLYLIHTLFVLRLKNLLVRVDHSVALNLVLMLVFGVPLTLALCYLFHLAFERRFMRNLSVPKKMQGEIFLASKEEQQTG